MAIEALGSFTKAAKTCGLSQPALTASIKRLEDDLGATLLERGRHGASLTAEGELFLSYARISVTAMSDAKRSLREMADLSVGEVRVGAGATACTYLLPKFVEKFRRNYPGIRFSLRESTPGEAKEALAAGEIDLAIVTSDVGTFWKHDPLVLIGPKKPIRRPAPFVTFRVGATTRALLEAHFPEADIVMELGSIAAVKGNVRAGVGIALVSESSVADDIKRGRLKKLRDKRTPIPRTLRILHRGHLPRAASAFYDLLVN